jgi:hypothetical protein
MTKPATTMCFLAVPIAERAALHDGLRHRSSGEGRSSRFKARYGEHLEMLPGFVPPSIRRRVNKAVGCAAIGR